MNPAFERVLRDIHHIRMSQQDKKQDTKKVKPLIKSIKKTNRCIIVEQGWSQSGVSSEIMSIIMENAFDWLDAPVTRITGKDVPMPYAENLEKLALPSLDELINAVNELI